MIQDPTPNSVSNVKVKREEYTCPKCGHTGPITHMGHVTVGLACGVNFFRDNVSDDYRRNLIWWNFQDHKSEGA